MNRNIQERLFLCWNIQERSFLCWNTNERSILCWNTNGRSFLCWNIQERSFLCWNIQERLSPVFNHPEWSTFSIFREGSSLSNLSGRIHSDYNESDIITRDPLNRNYQKRSSQPKLPVRILSIQLIKKDPLWSKGIMLFVSWLSGRIFSELTLEEEIFN